MTDNELTDILHEKRNELAKVELSLTDFEKELKRREKWAEKTSGNDGKGT